ncbi:MAG TPA: alpha/beta fold hydrolase [Alphaproteobacteria bacterium]|nr:alpha/beta fold hydrolase [Alphaproteobacteria bacterium]
MPDFDNNSARVHYELVGSGPPLLLIAGIASDGASWGPLTPLLAQRFRLILIDNRGSGRTRSEGAIGFADMVGDCVAVLDHLGLAEAGVVGHSMGGYIGLLLAAQHPQRVRRLVTMATAALSPKVRLLFEDLGRLHASISPQDWFRLLYQWLFSEPFFADPRNVAAAAEASAAYPYRQSPADFARQLETLKTPAGLDAAAILCPVLALAAERDLLVTDAMVAATHAPIPDHRLETIAGAAHSLHWEAPLAVAETLRAFLG